MKDNQANRNQWPMAFVVEALPSHDGVVRKVDIRVVKEGPQRVFSRPVAEVVPLFSPQD